MYKLTLFAKKLRKESTDTECKLWQQLRSKQCGGYKFRRQHPLGNYIVDFVCLESRLIIELDGSQHLEETKMHDQQRDCWFQKEGYRILRFWDNEVLQNMAGVYQLIEEALRSPSP